MTVRKISIINGDHLETATIEYEKKLSVFSDFFKRH